MIVSINMKIVFNCFIVLFIILKVNKEKKQKDKQLNYGP